jgi:hypothetical protein
VQQCICLISLMASAIGMHMVYFIAVKVDNNIAPECWHQIFIRLRLKSTLVLAVDHF